MNKIIALDMDDVLCETIDAFLKEYNYNIKWKKISREDVTDHEFENIRKYDLSFEERYQHDLDFFQKNDTINLVKPVVWAKEKILEWKKKWYKLYIITWRPEIIRKQTESWINHYYPNIFEEIFLANLDESNATPKSLFCENIWAEVMVEDNLMFAREVAKKWIKVYLLDNPWNREYDEDLDKGIVKVESWTEIEI